MKGDPVECPRCKKGMIVREIFFGKHWEKDRYTYQCSCGCKKDVYK